MKRKGSLRRVKGIAMGAEGIVIRKDKGSGGNPFSAKFPKNRRKKSRNPQEIHKKNQQKSHPPKIHKNRRKKSRKKIPPNFRKRIGQN